MFKRISDTAFDIDAPVLKNESVRDYQFYSYNAPNPDELSRICLQVHDTSRYCLPAEAFIQVEGRILQADGTAVPDGEQPGFVNNDIMALFKSAIYVIDGKKTLKKLTMTSTLPRQYLALHDTAMII